MSELRRHMMMQSGGGGGLPSEYQQVEYLQSTGTQYINPLWSPTNRKLRIEIEVQLTNSLLFGWVNLAGVWRRLRPLRYSNITLEADYISGLQLPISESMDKYVVELDGIGGISFSNDTKGYNTSASSGAVCVPSNGFLIFGTTTYTGGVSLSYGKIARCAAYENDELVFDIISCYRKADNEAGMYDIANGVFYTNAGTGSFIVGPDI